MQIDPWWESSQIEASWWFTGLYLENNNVLVGWPPGRLIRKHAVKRQVAPGSTRTQSLAARTVEYQRQYPLKHTSSLQATTKEQPCVESGKNMTRSQEYERVDNHKNTGRQKVKNIRKVIRTRNRNFDHWEDQREGRNERPTETTTIVTTVGIVDIAAIIHRRKRKLWPYKMTSVANTVTMTGILCDTVHLRRTKTVWIAKPQGIESRCSWRRARPNYGVQNEIHERSTKGFAVQ